METAANIQRGGHSLEANAFNRFTELYGFFISTFNIIYLFQSINI